MSARRLILLVGLLLLPTIACAKQSDTWDFTGNQLPGSWQVGGWTERPEATQNGLHIRAAQDGQMLREVDEGFPIDAVEITLSSARPGQGFLLWQSPQFPQGTLAQFPFAINGDPAETVRLDMSAIPGWDGRTGKLGIGLPAGSDVTLQSIAVEHWDWVENIGYAWESFWTFDALQDYSINFLWGPLIAGNPVGVETLFATLPPHAHSANILFYALIAIAALVLFAHWISLRLSGKDIPRFPYRPLTHVSLHLGLLAAIVAACFTFYDVRMGLEYLSYANHDYVTYISKPPGERTLRGFANLHDVLALSAPVLRQEKQFGFFTPPHTESRIRYATYPALGIQNAASGVRTWLVFERPDVTVDAKGELTAGGNVISKPGRVIEQYGPRSFLFQTP